MIGLTGYWALDWATLSVSVLNFMLLTWLSVTVLLNADRRDWGVWLMSGGLIIGSVFFVCHTIILSQLAMETTSHELNFWWHIGWIPVIIAPTAWYIVVLWYAGYWNPDRSILHSRHGVGLLVIVFQILLLIGLFIFNNPIPDYDQIINLDFPGGLLFSHTPPLFILVPVLMVACIAMSMDALLHPLPAKRALSEQARRRSRPWLFATTVILMIVCILVALFVAYILALHSGDALQVAIDSNAIAGLDLVLSSLIVAAVILLGQAIVSYEVFTGKTLPRQALVSQWRAALTIAFGCAILVGASTALSLRPIYSLLLIALLLIMSYGVYAWRSFIEREQFTNRLRPFVTSERLINSFVRMDTSATNSQANSLFNTVCRTVLNTQCAQLIPLGALAPLVGSPLIYPFSSAPQPVKYPPPTESTIQALDPGQSGGYLWSVPLWAERGIIGTILIGPKHDSGLYTQEEIEIARASGERIIDMLAAEQMATRLMQLQRQRLTETQVMDFRTRRLLHDNVLPSLHSTLLQLSRLAKDSPGVQDAVSSLIGLHGEIADLIYTAHNSKPVAENNVDFASTLQNMVNSEFAGEFETVTWNIESISPLDKMSGEIILGAVREVIRNAAIHGRGNEPKRILNLKISIKYTNQLDLMICDDGVGLAPHQKSIMGSGNGLALHGTLLAIIGGNLTVERGADVGTMVLISVPLPG
jgi:signal transduction histidine kinase